MTVFEEFEPQNVVGHRVDPKKALLYVTRRFINFVLLLVLLLLFFGITFFTHLNTDILNHSNKEEPSKIDLIFSKADSNNCDFTFRMKLPEFMPNLV